MKKLLLAIALGGAMSGSAQTDSTKSEKADTIRVGGMIIIKKKDKDGDKKDNTSVVLSNRKKKSSNLSTNWWIIDLGFANINDQTNYAASQASGFTGPGIGEDQMDLRTGKSINVNVWFFMQRLNLIKKVVNLKYGLGLELNNYHFDDERIKFSKNPTTITLDQNLADIKKNKLAADYLTVPIMLNFNFTPNHKKGFGLSAGVSAGYLYSSRQKIKDNNDKSKLRDDFNLEKWKLSYIGELNLGPIRLYGSYAMNNMWERGLDQTPYNVGIRLSHW
ncbi:MAG TPA: outer membrane beta-barrel protein [Flavisolibacter sp.]|nr:outer membrane beta-barrel protein [Flavisolibacter sp.]